MTFSILSTHRLPRKMCDRAARIALILQIVCWSSGCSDLSSLLLLQADSDSEARTEADPEIDVPKAAASTPSGLSHEPPASRIAPVTNSSATIADSPDQLFEDVRFLSSDRLEGRGLGTEGLDLAADYIAKRFDQVGLNTTSYKGTPFQKFSWKSRLSLGTTTSAKIAGPNAESVPMVFGTDFRPLTSSVPSTFDLPIAFVGYGITAPKLEYDDYDGLSLSQHAVIILRHEPQQDDPESLFNGTEHSEHALVSSKIRNAVKHGAAAVILCTDQRAIDNHESEASVDPDGLLFYRFSTSPGARSIPVIHCRRRVINRVLQASTGRSLAEIELTIDDGLRPQSQLLEGWRFSGKVSALGPHDSLRNVIGILKGNGRFQQETVIVGSHYDHLGWGGIGSLSLNRVSEIHNGADDNASGTAVMIRVAELLSSRTKRLDRRICFIGFTAEEHGLIGSGHYVRNPLIPMADTIAMINLDMVGRLRKDQITAYGTGTAHSFPTLLNELSGEHALTITKRSSGFGPSDHASFHAHGVPVLHFFTGFHSRYHAPGDDFDTLNLKGMERVSRMVADLIVRLANADSRPQVPSLHKSPAGHPLATIRSRTGQSTGKAILGVKRDAEHTGKGFAVRQVVARSAAAAAGFRSGDIIMQLDDHIISQAPNLTAAVSSCKPGDVVTILIRRGIAELEVKATLGIQ